MTTFPQPFGFSADDAPDGNAAAPAQKGLSVMIQFIVSLGAAGLAVLLADWANAPQTIGFITAVVVAAVAGIATVAGAVAYYTPKIVGALRGAYDQLRNMQHGAAGPAKEIAKEVGTVVMDKLDQSAVPTTLPEFEKMFERIATVTVAKFMSGMTAANTQPPPDAAPPTEPASATPPAIPPAA